MYFNCITNINKKKNCSAIEIKLTRIKKFLDFSYKSKRLVIWKIWLSDFSGEAIFFCDEKPIVSENRIFKISNISQIFHRGKKRFIFRKSTLKIKNNELFKINLGYSSNLSLIEYKLL